MDCLDRNGNISLYKVRYGLTSSAERETMDVSTRVFTATGLVPRMSYTFDVEAVNFEDFFRGPPASISVETSVPEGRFSRSCPNNLYSQSIK